MPDFRITPRARDDLKEIGRYTLKIWGKKQCNIYLRDLNIRFQWLAQNPRLGKHRADVKEGYYCFPQGSHVIFYILRDGGIDIIGIPHQHMDILSHFNS